MKKVFFIACIIFGWSACSKDVNPDTPANDLPPFETFKSYIQTFINSKKKIVIHSVAGVKTDETKKIFGRKRATHVWYVGDTILDVFSVSDGIVLHIYGHKPDFVFGEIDTCRYDSYHLSSSYTDEAGRAYEIENKRKYDYYTALIGDTSYNVRSREIPPERAIITPLDSITIVTDKDFSSDYPTGSNLSPLFTVYFNDPYSTVKNGYKSVEGSYRFYEEAPPHPVSIVKAKLSEANFAERPFIGDEWYCQLDVAPEKTNTYTFRVKVTFVDGTVLEATAPLINIKGTND
jgi:hypothetical protein